MGRSRENDGWGGGGERLDLFVYNCMERGAGVGLVGSGVGWFRGYIPQS